MLSITNMPKQKDAERLKIKRGTKMYRVDTNKLQHRIGMVQAFTP